jgi:hypothetical protein
MTTDDRVEDSRKIEREMLSRCGPWYCSMARLRMQDQNYISGNFTKAVAVCRRYRQWPEEEFDNELRVWDPQDVVH